MIASSSGPRRSAPPAPEISGDRRRECSPLFDRRSRYVLSKARRKRPLLERGTFPPPGFGHLRHRSPYAARRQVPACASCSRGSPRHAGSRVGAASGEKSLSPPPLFAFPGGPRAKTARALTSWKALYSGQSSPFAPEMISLPPFRRFAPFWPSPVHSPPAPAPASATKRGFQDPNQLRLPGVFGRPHGVSSSATSSEDLQRPFEIELERLMLVALPCRIHYFFVPLVPRSPQPWTSERFLPDAHFLYEAVWLLGGTRA